MLQEPRLIENSGAGPLLQVVVVGENRISTFGRVTREPFLFWAKIEELQLQIQFLDLSSLPRPKIYNSNSTPSPSKMDIDADLDRVKTPNSDPI